MISPEVLARMTDVMTHGGPMTGGSISARRRDRRQAVEHRRCRRRASAVLERDEHGLGGAERRALQPRGAWTELRADGHSFASLCDTEILPHLYERYGTAMPQKLRGKFAFVVWTRSAGAQSFRATGSG